MGTGAVAVSVVMPTRSQRRWLPQAVESVLTQGDAVAELIVVDGDGGDGTVDWLARAAALHPGRLRWRSAPDHGPAAALSLGVSLARQPWIGWLNSDDLLAPGAVDRLAAHVARQPDAVMVYGRAEHVDDGGHAIAAYPTRPPPVTVEALADGCFVCQPSAFFRRDAWEAVGGVDTSLATAFDLDLWLRLFRRHPDRIGFVDAVQARSRLHGETITARRRRDVALEAIRLLRRHLDRSSPHWLETWFAERLAEAPRPPGTGPGLLAELDAAIAEAEGDLGASAAEALRRDLRSHRAVMLAARAPGTAADVTPDGWTTPDLQVRWRQPADGRPPLRALRIVARHAHPAGAAMRLRWDGPDGPIGERRLVTDGPFELVLDAVDLRPGALHRHRIECLDPFVPAEVDPGSTDRRRLGFRVESLEPLA